MPSPLGGDGNTELFQRLDVAPQRTAVDPQPFGQLPAAHVAVGLQQFEQCQHANGGIGHAEGSCFQ